jgi:hypothetical protein
MSGVNIEIGGVRLEIVFPGGESDRLGRAIGRAFPDYLASEGGMNIPIAVRRGPDVPLGGLFGREETGALRDYFRKIEGRFPFTGLNPGWRGPGIKKMFGGPKGDGAVSGPPSMIHLLDKDRMAVFYHNSFLLFADYEKPSGEVLIFESEFTDDASTISRAVQAAVGLFAPLYGGIMLHACSAEIDGGGCIFFGVSGAGKSTIANLVGRERLLADDGSLCFRRGGGCFTMPSPFTQVKARENAGELIPVERLFFLVKDENDFLEGVTPGEAISRIMHNHIHFFRYFPQREARETFMTVKEMVERFPTHNLHFTRDFHPLTFFGEMNYNNRGAGREVI